MTTALLFIHGFLTGTDDWDYFLPSFEKEYDRVALFGHPGHARAGEKTDYRKFTVKRTYDELDKTLAMLSEYDEVDVVGHSMGGGMVMYVAAKLKNVRRAVAVSPALKYPRFGFVSRKNAVIKKLRALAKKADGELSEALIKSADRVDSIYREGTAAFKKRLFPHWSPHNLLTFARIMKRAKKYVGLVTCPLTVIWGELDEFVPRSSPELILSKSKSKDKQFVVYADMGHGMLYEKNAPVIVRDVGAALKGLDLTEVCVGKSELRTAYRITENGTVKSRHTVEIAGGRAREVTERTASGKTVFRKSD